MMDEEAGPTFSGQELTEAPTPVGEGPISFGQQGPSATEGGVQIKRRERILQIGAKIMSIIEAIIDVALCVLFGLAAWGAANPVIDDKESRKRQSQRFEDRQFITKKKEKLTLMLWMCVAQATLAFIGLFCALIPGTYYGVPPENVFGRARSLVHWTVWTSLFIFFRCGMLAVLVILEFDVFGILLPILITSIVYQVVMIVWVCCLSSELSKRVPRSGDGMGTSSPGYHSSTPSHTNSQGWSSTNQHTGIYHPFTNNQGTHGYDHGSSSPFSHTSSHTSSPMKSHTSSPSSRDYSRPSRTH